MPRINPSVPLAYSLAASIGRYALFIGAGVSKDAGVPSGKDIFELTVKKIEALNDLNPEDKKQLYLTKSYSELIGLLFPSNEEQRSFLSGLFKNYTPGGAHRHIAALIKRGFFKFVITTNFDNLLENALDEAGMKNKYSVITEENIASSKPWVHEEYCRIYKIHGTIENGHIRNTQKDIASLNSLMLSQVSQLLESHGLLVLGYSADEDACFDYLLKNRVFKGYSVYWTDFKNSLTARAKTIISAQEAHIVPIESAEIFLGELSERIFSALALFADDARQSVIMRFKNLLLSPSPKAELMQAIDGEKKNLADYISRQLSKPLCTPDELWAVFKAVFDYCERYILFTEQVIKYYPEQFMRCASLLDELNGLTSDDYQKNSVIYYLYFCLLEIIGALLIENKSYSLLSKMLKMKRLNFTQDGMENSLDWVVQVDFLHKISGISANSKPATLMFHNLLELAAGLPLGFNIKDRLLETDILFLVYSVKYQLKATPPYWFARAPLYCSDMPKLFYHIKHDGELASKIAADLFETSVDDLYNAVRFADKLINNEFSPWYANSLNAKRVLKNF